MDDSETDPPSSAGAPVSADAAQGASAAALAAAQDPAARAAAGSADNSADGAESLPPVGGLAAAGAAGAAKVSTAALAAARVAANVVSVEKASAVSADDGDDKHPQGAADISAAAPDGSTAAAGLLQLNSNSPPSAAAAAPTPSFQVHASVDSSEFAQGLADRVSWMASNGLSSAKLQVNPPSLGPIELRISVTGDHAQVSMSAHSTVTRDALESSSPKLREMLGAQGFSQVSVDISQRSFQDRSAHPQPYEQASANTQKAAAASAVAAAASSAKRVSLGVVDAYA